MQRVRRSVQVRAVDDSGLYEMRAVSYDVVDSFRTIFKPFCGSEGLRNHLPVIAWAHDWNEPVGRAVAYRDEPDGLYLQFRLDEDPSVPRAMQAATQLKSGTLTDVSIGFSVPEGGDRRNEDGIVEFTKIEIDECSLVLKGAVPGARVLALRSDTVINAHTATQIIAGFAAGQIDLADALGQVKAAAVTPAPVAPEKTEETKPEAPVEQPAEEPTEPEVAPAASAAAPVVEQPAVVEPEAQPEVTPAADVPVEVAPNSPEVVETIETAEPKVEPDTELDALLADAESVLAGREL